MPLEYENVMLNHPPGGFQFIHTETGHVTVHINWAEMIAEATKYRRLNNLPIPQGFEIMAMDLDCKRKPPGFCRDVKTGQGFNPQYTARLTHNELIAGTAVMKDWIVAGRPREDVGEIKRRLAVCKGCSFNLPFEGCASCSSQTVHDVVNWFVKNEEFPDDQSMRACYFCKCANSAQARIPLDILQAHLTDQINELLPSHCWKKKV